MGLLQIKMQEKRNEVNNTSPSGSLGRAPAGCSPSTHLAVHWGAGDWCGEHGVEVGGSQQANRRLQPRRDMYCGLTVPGSVLST